jgi:hypothetical protein
MDAQAPEEIDTSVAAARAASSVPAVCLDERGVA